MSAWILPRLGYSLMAVAVVALILREELLSLSPSVLVLQGLALALMVWARFSLGWRSFRLSAAPTSGGLVTSGPYRWIRHPIYAAIILFVTAGVVARWSLAGALWGMVLLIGIMIRLYEEEHALEAQYREYRAYARRTKRFIPIVV